MPARRPRPVPDAPGNWPRRLTHAQYNRTMRDLLGDQTRPAAQFPPEDFVNGFRNQIEAQGVPALLAEAYGAAAERLARSYFRGAPSPCPQPAVKCAGDFARDFGQRAFRRRLSETEIARYAAMRDPQLVVEAMLQSPNFLFRVESGAHRPHEIATRLSYFLWDTMPDETLFRAAASGELATRAGIERAARRMVSDPRAREAVEEFAAEWLRFDTILVAVKDRRQFPQFNPELAASMTQEVRRLVDDLVWNDRDFMALYSAGYSFLSSDLANLYKLPVPPAEFDRVEFPESSPRAGILGMAHFLTLTSKPEDTSPTGRGLFVREHFLCQHVPDPPPGTNSNLPPLVESKPQTNRERLDQHLSNASCATCHRLIDPIGFGFEKFDAIGAYREKARLVFPSARRDRERPPNSVELPLDTTGTVAGIPNSDFSSPKELGRVLAASRQCQECVVKQLFRFGYGRGESPADRATLDAAYEKFRVSGFRFKELLVALATAYASEIAER
ncbi:MAG: DUF1592 domain-containing protein [Bryobacteraceae bacterium]